MFARLVRLMCMLMLLLLLLVVVFGRCTVTVCSAVVIA